MQKVRAKPHRLPAAAYYGSVVVAFTACELKRKNLFHSPEIVAASLDILRLVTDKYACDVPVYCFMPDHLHVVINGKEFRSRAKFAMDEFKQLTGYWLKANAPEFEWQDDFYDHIIRKHEDWRRQVQYIAFNPVRAGLVQDPFDYPFTGSIGHDLNELLVESTL